MSVKIGSARIDENGRAHGGKAGDQTGREVGTQSWYLHSKGWRVFRAKSAEAAEKIAWDMQAACDNSHIGYDQYERLTLYEISKPLGFDCKKVATNCETDCSGLVRVCCAFAGIQLPNFRTPSEPSALLESGAFDELIGGKYTSSPDYLKRGDILVTRTQGHTVVVLSNGSKAGTESVVIAPVAEYKLGERELRNGCDGADVKQLQADLIKLGFDCGKWGADGDFGDATELAVEAFQRAQGIDVDGIVGPETIKKLADALAWRVGGCGEDACPLWLEVVGGNCYVRSAPNTDGRKLGVAHCGDKLLYQGQDSPEGWHLVEFKGENGWVSGRYSRLLS